MLAILDKLRVEEPSVRDWSRMVLVSQARDTQADSHAQREELTRQQTLIVQQQDRLLNMRLADDIDQEVVAKKAGRRRWFTEHGSTKWINDEGYLEQAIHYVLHSQDHRENTSH